MGKNSKKMSYILQFIDSARFTASLLSNLVTNLYEGNLKIKCKYGHDDKKCGTFGITYYNFFLECTNLKDDLIKLKCLYCNKSYQQKFDDFLIHTNFLATAIVSLFYFCEKVFIPMNIWMTAKNSMKYHY